MEERDAIVWWLEQNSNFLRVTVSSPFSPSSRRGRVNLREVVQTESHALNELAACVNRNLPGSNWDARHAKQMLQQYLLEYRSTAEAAANPQFILDEKDELLGIQTVQAKLDGMCRHFRRLQQLHDPGTIASRERERKRMERGRENQQSNGQRQQPTAKRTMSVKVHVNLTERQRSEREEVVPESELSNLHENSETDRDTALQSNLTGGSAKMQERTSKKAIVRKRRTSEGNIPRAKKKQRHVDTPSEKNGTVDVVDLTLSQTTQSTSSASEGSQDSPLLDENTASGNIHSGKTQSSGHKRNIVHTLEPTIEASRQTRQGTQHSSNHPLSTLNTVVADALRSAIAQVVSQRQQLLSRQRSRSDSDSDVDTPSLDAKPRASRNMPPADTPRSRNEPVPSAGFLPPLIAKSKVCSAKANMKRKRAFFRAKELAFEQLRWQRENELQQLELALLRREMEARQSLAKDELKLQRMRVRADLIQPLISAGVSVTDIAERLRLL
ncbi:hypothetical protein PInf_009261 [Phytophthora infestans]|nr:hypothetical protein PInf_009261 [Phytophthora infestans]